ncbi:MAG: diguanylate cyclase, partial [Ilumatobacteraceae bacterium]
MADIIELLPTLPVGLFQADREGRVSAANAAFGALVQGSAGSPIGVPPWANAHPGDRASAELQWRRAADSDRVVQLEFRVWHGEGRMTWVRIDAQPMLDSLSRVIGYGGTALDHTEQVGQEQLLDRLMGVVGATDDAVLILDRNGSPVYTNEAARRLFGVNDQLDLIRDPAARGLLQAIRDQVPREIMASSASSMWSGEVGFRGPDGLERTLDIDLMLHRSADGIVEYWGGVARDITATKHLQSELTRQANHDPLTGLPNRLLLLRTAADALDGIRGMRKNVAILFMDVDRLKDVNDTVGHEVGDALLTQVATRISHATRPSDVVARIGGDEFVVLCDGGI